MVKQIQLGLLYDFLRRWKMFLVTAWGRVSIRPMKNLRLISTLATLLSLWSGGLRAAVVSEAPVVTVKETSATVKWATDTECGTQLKFGLNQNALLRHVEGDVGVKHQVEANALLPGTQYFYTIGTAKKLLQTGAFTTKGTPPKGAASVAQPKPAPPPAPVASATYTAPPTKKTWGDRYSLADHFTRHGGDFAAKDVDTYAAKAWLFLQRAMDEGLAAKLDETDGTIRVWEGKTHTFAAYNRDFTTKTFFKPNSGDYFTRQPGKPVRLRHAPAKP